MSRNKKSNFGYTNKLVEKDENIEVIEENFEKEIDVDEDIISHFIVEPEKINEIAYSKNSNEVKKIKGKVTLISPNYIVIIDELGNGIRVDGKFDYKYGEIVEI